MTFPIATASSVVRDILEVQIADVWTTGCGLPAAAIAWQNTDRDPVKSNHPYWLDVFLRFGVSYHGTLGGKGSDALNEKNALLFLNIYGPKSGLGVATIQGYADKIVQRFSRGEFSGVTTMIESGPINNTMESEMLMAITISVQYWERV